MAMTLLYLTYFMGCINDKPPPTGKSSDVSTIPIAGPEEEMVKFDLKELRLKNVMLEQEDLRVTRVMLVRQVRLNQEDFKVLKVMLDQADLKVTRVMLARQMKGV